MEVTGDGFKFDLEERAGDAGLAQLDGVVVLAVFVHGQTLVRAVVVVVQRRHLRTQPKKKLGKTR